MSTLLTVVAALIRFWPTVRLLLGKLLSFPDDETRKKYLADFHSREFGLSVQVARETKNTSKLEEYAREKRASDPTRRNK